MSTYSKTITAVAVILFLILVFGVWNGLRLKSILEEKSNQVSQATQEKDSCMKSLNDASLFAETLRKMADSARFAGDTKAQEIDESKVAESENMLSESTSSQAKEVLESLKTFTNDPVINNYNALIKMCADSIDSLSEQAE